LAAALVGGLAVAGAAIFGATGTAVAAGLGVIFALLAGASLSRAITRTSDGASPIPAAESGHRINPGGPPELRTLARAVNRMSGAISGLTESESKERSRLASVLDAVQEGVLVVDREGVVESANPAAIMLLGAPGPFRPGLLLTNLTGSFEIHEAAVYCARAGVPRQAQVGLPDRSYPGPGGIRRLLDVTATPLGAQSGPGRALVLISDITGIRAADTTRREFASNVSHELRTPIAAIKAAVETLQRGAAADPAARDDFLRRVQEDADRMEALVSEMLELSRLESGQTPLHLAPLDAGRLIESVADRFKHQAAGAGLTIRTEPGGSAHVNADLRQLERVLSNLVGNAIKFTPTGGSITLSVQQSNGTVSLQVRDTGRGIAPEHLPHVFERFYKGDQPRNEGGAGLGLAIARHIVQAHGGIITVESYPGLGALFTVSLPALSAL